MPGWPAFSSSLPATTVNFSFSGNATIQAGGGIITDIAGYPAGQGPGDGRSYSACPLIPAAERVMAAMAPTAPEIMPRVETFMIQSNVTHQLWQRRRILFPLFLRRLRRRRDSAHGNGTLQMDGTISANGGGGSGTGGGGGSGGSIWLTVGTLSGAGSITANGGSGVDSMGGGGGGGIVSFPATTICLPGPRRRMAAAERTGAVREPCSSKPTDKTASSSWTTADIPEPTRCYNPRARRFDPAQRRHRADFRPATFGNLLVSSNAWLLITNYSGYTMTLSSATIQAGGGIIADAAGYPSGQGLGAGQSSSSLSTYPWRRGGARGLRRKQLRQLRWRRNHL